MALNYFGCSAGWYGWDCGVSTTELDKTKAAGEVKKSFRDKMSKDKTKFEKLCHDEKFVTLCPNSSRVPPAKKLKCSKSNRECLKPKYVKSAAGDKTNCEADGTKVFCGLSGMYRKVWLRPC